MDIAKLMTGAAIAPSWDARVSGLKQPAASGPQGEGGDLQLPALKLKAQPVSDSDSAPGFEQIEAMRDAINKTARNRLQIDRAEDNGRFIYRILDPDTGETMRQWPPERYLELVEYLNDKRGGLVDESA